MRSELQRGLLVLCSLLEIGLYAAAGVSPAALADDALDKVVAVDIAAQPLGSALAQLSTQSGTQIQVAPVVVGERKTEGVHGRMPVRDALSALLKGSTLGFHAAGGNAIDIDAAPGRVVFASAAPATASTKPATTLGEIVVTATKREQSVRKIAGTVDVLRGKDLEDIGAREMEDFLKYVPGITLQEGSTSNSRTISIRGVGPQPGANTTVGVLIDDVSMSDPYASYLVPDLDPFDLHDLEVLKGPQGTLFGASALVGAIRYVLNKPLLGEWEAKGFADWLHVQGAGSGPTFGGMVNVPLGEKAAVRLVDVVQELPGLYDDVNANGKNQRDADNGYKRMSRIMGSWQPLDQLSVNAFYLRQTNHRNDLSVANNLDGDFRRTDTPGPSTSSQAFSVANLDIRYNFDWATLISETSHNAKSQNLDVDTSAVVEALAVQGIQSLRTQALVNSRSTAQEVRLVSAPGDSPWVWLAGAYYNRYRASLVDDIYLANTQELASVLNGLGLPPDLTSIVTPSSQGVSVIYINYDPLEAKEESLFGELTRKFWGNRLQFTVGGRLYREELSTEVKLGGLTAPLGELENYSGLKTMKSEGFNPKATVLAQLTSNILWYANASHGFQFGGLNPPAAIPTDNTFPLSYKPSTVWSYETGERLDAFHKTLQFDLTAFLLNWKNMQIQQQTPDGVTGYTANIGAARSKGLELSVRYLTPIPGLILINTGSYIHAKVAEPYTTSSGTFVPVGSDLPAAPRLQTSTTLAYNIALGSVRTGAGVTFSHQGHAFNDIQHDMTIYRYNTLAFNYNLSFPHVFMAPSFTLNATNLTDTHALVGAQLNHVANFTDGTLGSFVRPRAIDLRISGQF